MGAESPSHLDIDPTQIDVAQVLHERARLLARPLDRPGAVQTAAKILVFIAGEERYGLPADQVEEVIVLRDIIRVPYTPPSIAGVVNTKGSVLTIVNLPAVFSGGKEAAIDEAIVITIRTSATEFGILADEIVGVVPVPQDTADHRFTDDRGTLVRLVVGEEAIVILDPDALARDPRLVVDEAS